MAWKMMKSSEPIPVQFTLLSRFSIGVSSTTSKWNRYERVPEQGVCVILWPKKCYGIICMPPEEEISRFGESSENQEKS